MTYPRELEEWIGLRDGTRLRVRPIRPDDEPRLVALYSRLSPRSQYQRFFAIRARLPEAWVHHLANVDYRERLALVAERSDTGDLIGVARFEPMGEDGVAELALVVEDAWQGRGLGTALLPRIMAAAEARGARRFRAEVLADNRRMLGMLERHADVESRVHERGVLTVILRPRPPSEAAPAA
jgi:RimJ/RimL family protein N-acetyltransferase